jgi:hypothetical protein
MKFQSRTGLQFHFDHNIYGDSKSKLYIDRESKRGYKKVRENEKESESRESQKRER